MNTRATSIRVIKNGTRLALPPGAATVCEANVARRVVARLLPRISRVETSAQYALRVIQPAFAVFGALRAIGQDAAGVTCS